MRIHARHTPSSPLGAGARPPALVRAAHAGPLAAGGRFVHDFSRIPLSSGPRVQRRLRLGAVDDVYERQAEHAAERVLDPTAPAERTRPGHGAALLQASRTTGGAPAAGEAPPVVHRVLAAPGERLQPETRGFMERRLGHDFSGVRVHTGAGAAESARAVDAEAYTVGRHVVFGAGRYAPHTAAGARLLAHELAHTVQQGDRPAAVQRALKFEFQTTNHVWAVKNTGAPDPKQLPRKYAPTSVGYAEGAGEERGDRPAYLSVGSKGGPAQARGTVVFVEAQGPLVMKEARSGVDIAKPAQVIRQYRFGTQVKATDLIGKPVAAGQLSLVSETDHGADPAMAGAFNPNTFEFKYLNADDTPVDVHLDEDRTFKTGHVKLMRTGRGDIPAVDKKKPAQFIETWKVTPDPAGPLELGGSKVKIERVDVVNHAEDPSMKGSFNPNTWRRNYFKDTDFAGGRLQGGATPLDVHVDEEGRFRPGKVKWMVKKTLARAEEQTAIELQSETGGVLEFETPKWFRDWPDLQERVQEAVDMTKAMNDQVGTAREVTDATVLDKIDDRKTTSTLGKVVEWPTSLSTAHLTNLKADKRRLLVQIVDSTWKAKIQASEGIALSRYGSLMQEHELPVFKGIVGPTVDALFTSAIQAARAKDPAVDESRFANLKGFLQLVASYIVRGQLVDLTGGVTKAGFRLMARTNFASMYKNLLSAEEQAVFRTLVGDPARPADNPLLAALEGPIDAERPSRGLPALTFSRSTRFFVRKAGSNPAKATLGPAVYDWLLNMTRGKDLLSGPGISDAMGAKTVETQPGTKAFRHAQFEVRGTVAHGGSVHPASGWVTFARAIFDAAKARSLDVPDDPSTPTVAETSRTVLRD
ncbi:MAG TPA: DUF4157 domain-containing protein [Longimicrobium sp.]|nr:DUF4157 domain-containing protein [Longimicrobium sp.]